MNTHSENVDNSLLSKESRLNKANLKQIGFLLADKYEDPEIGYTVFSFKNIDVMIEKNGWYVEIHLERSTMKMEGVKTIEDIKKLKELVYGN